MLYYVGGMIAIGAMSILMTQRSDRPGQPGHGAEQHNMTYAAGAVGDFYAIPFSTPFEYNGFDGTTSTYSDNYRFVFAGGDNKVEFIAAPNGNAAPLSCARRSAW